LGEQLCRSLSATLVQTVPAQVVFRVRVGGFAAARAHEPALIAMAASAFGRRIGVKGGSAAAQRSQTLDAGPATEHNPPGDQGMSPNLMVATALVVSF
jgi:hypothetical protein